MLAATKSDQRTADDKESLKDQCKLYKIAAGKSCQAITLAVAQHMQGLVLPVLGCVRHRIAGRACACAGAYQELRSVHCYELKEQTEDLTASALEAFANLMLAQVRDPRLQGLRLERNAARACGVQTCAVPKRRVTRYAEDGRTRGRHRSASSTPPC